MKNLITSLFLCCFGLSLYGQGIGYAFRNISTKEGLSNDFIRDMDIDGQGFLWIATEEGLNRWTSSGNTVYRENNSGLASHELTTLYYDKTSNSIWTGSREKGVCIFDCHTQQFGQLSTRDGLASNSITDIMPAADGGIWIAHEGNGISHYNREARHTDRLYNEKTLPGMKDKTRCCKDDGNGYLYVGHIGYGMSVINLKDHTVKRFTNEPGNVRSLPGNIVRTICIDHLKNIWVGTNKGIALFNPQTEEFTCARHEEDNPHSLAGDNIHHIVEMDDETLWIASDLGGISILDLHRFDGQGSQELHFENITQADSDLSSPNARVVVQDSFGNRWIGHHSTGVDFIGNNRSRFHILPFYDRKGDRKTLSRVYGIAANGTDGLWLGGENRLACCRNFEVVKEWNVGDYQPHSYSVIYAMARDASGRIWMGIDDEGVLRYDPRRNAFEHVDLGLEGMDVRAFYEDGPDRMLIGTEKGVYISSKDSIARMTVPEWDASGFYPVVFSLMKDTQGKTWVGTLGSGVYIIGTDGKMYAHLYEGNGLYTNNINHIIRDRDNGLWIATFKGLVYIKDTEHPELKVYNEKQGLADNHIRAIQQDKMGNIWVSTYTGVACLDLYRQKFHNYDYHYGVPAGGFMESSAAILPDGTVCFGSLHGLCYFQPQQIGQADAVSPIQVISCESLGRAEAGGKAEVAVPDEKGIVRLPYRRNTFRISFTVPDYAQEGQTEYVYRMEGLERVWYGTEGESQITFRNIAPGRYTFRVMARLKNGEWDEAHAASLQIMVSPPVWAAWYAKTFYLLCVLLAVYLLFRSYKRKLLLQNSLEMEKKSLEVEKLSRQKEQKLNDEKLRFYTNMAHELRTPLTLIIGPLEDLKDDDKLSGQYRHKVHIIHRSAVQLLNLINQLMEFRKTETQNRRLTVSKGDIGKLVTEIGLRYKELNRNAQVEVGVQVEPLRHAVYFDADAVTIILNNLLSNALKYTPAGKIDLSLRQTEQAGTEYVEIAVSDTGYGIDKEAVPHIYERYYQAKGKHQASGTGIGLALVKSLVDLHQGTLEVESEPGKGSTFVFRIQADNTYPQALHKEEPEVALPLPEAETENVSGEEQNEESVQPVLLVAEDNRDIREYIVSEFRADFKVLEAANGKEAWILAQKEMPNIIVSDIMMPETDGITFCRMVKEDVCTSHIPVILLTAKDSLQDKVDGYESGADSYLTKPFSAKLLRIRIQNLLDMRKRLARQFAATIRDDVPVTGTADAGTVRPTDAGAGRPLSKLDAAFLEKLTSVIEENLDAEKMDMAFLTGCMNMSQSTFYRKVKALTDLSPNEFIRKLRLRHCLQLLKSGDYNITEAASMTGFNNMGHFRECFKEEYGLSPSEYLRQHP